MVYIEITEFFNADNKTMFNFNHFNMWCIKSTRSFGTYKETQFLNILLIPFEITRNMEAHTNAKNVLEKCFWIYCWK